MARRSTAGSREPARAVARSIMRLMTGRSLIRLALLFLFVLMSSICGFSQESADFAGQWGLRIGNRVFLVLTLKGDQTSRFSGSLRRIQHFSSNSGGSFSGIKGPVVTYPIIGSEIKDKCLRFTTQNPSDKDDQDPFQLCIAGAARATLRLDAPGFEPWPMSKETQSPTIATDWDSQKTYYLDDTEVSNSEMQRIFEEDQKVRQPGVGKIDWAVVSKSDAARRTATAKLLEEGKLHTGEDFERAAFLFQHSDNPNDYLLAHTLAMVAVAHGRADALWIASATLDRYLQSIQHPQIYGTQFLTKEKEPTTQEPYNRNLVSDSLRKYLNVPSQAAQEEQRKEYDRERAAQ